MFSDVGTIFALHDADIKHIKLYDRTLKRRFSTMAPNLVYLPNGQTLTVSPVFAGLSFKSNDLNVHHSIFPPGWTIILESGEDYDDGDEPPLDEREQMFGSRKHPPHRFKVPTLHNDNLFISSISNPSNTDFKPATSPTRQIAMMLWATLWWYFHQVQSRPTPPNCH